MYLHERILSGVSSRTSRGRLLLREIESERERDRKREREIESEIERGVSLTRPAMARTRPGNRVVGSYTIPGTNNIVQAGDCVLLRPSESNRAPYVARVERIEADYRNDVKVRVRWYYRPEEVAGGRTEFHGLRELFLSDHYDMQSADTIVGKCIVYSFENYINLPGVGPEDYYCRLEYKPSTGAFVPDRLPVFCKCQTPFNPDHLMIHCKDCKNWFHPACLGMPVEQACPLDRLICSQHGSLN